MSTTTEITRRPDTYALGHTPQEYERLRAQARDWEAATARVLGQISLPGYASCLDAGCGPGETTRLLAQRVGPRGRARHRRRRLDRHLGGGDVARQRLPELRLPRPRPHRRRACPWRALRPRVRAAAADPPSRPRRRAGPAVGCRRPGRLPGGAGLRRGRVRRPAGAAQLRRVDAGHHGHVPRDRRRRAHRCPAHAAVRAGRRRDSGRHRCHRPR